MAEPLHPKPESRPGQSPVAGVAEPLSRSQSFFPGAGQDGGCDEELRLIAEQAQMLTLASGAAIALRQGEFMVCRARGGSTAPDLGARLDTQSGLSGECVRTGKTLVCADTENDARVNLNVCRYLGIRSIAVLPILLEQEVVGVFEAFSAQPGAFSSNEVAALESMRDLVISVIRPAPPAEDRPRAVAAPPRTATIPAAPPPVWSVPETKPEKVQPFPMAVEDPGDDLICEIEERAHGIREEDDPLIRALERLKKTESADSIGQRGLTPLDRLAPDDDLLCEIEMRAGVHEATTRPEAHEGLSAFTPAPVRVQERPISRKLIAAGVVVAVAGLVWLGWCNHAQQQAKTSAAPDKFVQAELRPAAADKPAIAAPAPAEAAVTATAQPEPTADDEPVAAEDPLPKASDSPEAPAPLPKRRLIASNPRVSSAVKPVRAKAKSRATTTGISSPVAALVSSSSAPTPAAPAPTQAAIPEPVPPAQEQQVRPSSSDPTSMAAVPAPPKPVSSGAPRRSPSTAGQLSLSQATVSEVHSLASGDAVSRDAMRLLRKSAEAGDPNAQLALAVRYANGDGVRQSYPEALKWFKRAQGLGVEVASTGPQAEAWDRVQEWKRSQEAKK